jgi:hypothetical protein
MASFGSSYIGVDANHEHEGGLSYARHGRVGSGHKVIGALVIL